MGNVPRIIGNGPPAPDHPTVRLADGGDVPTYDPVTVAAVLDEHTEHLRQLEVRMQTRENAARELARQVRQVQAEQALSPWARLVRWVREGGR